MIFRAESPEYNRLMHMEPVCVRHFLPNSHRQKPLPLAGFQYYIISCSTGTKCTYCGWGEGHFDTICQRFITASYSSVAITLLPCNLSESECSNITCFPYFMFLTTTLKHSCQWPGTMTGSVQSYAMKFKWTGDVEERHAGTVYSMATVLEASQGFKEALISFAII